MQLYLDQADRWFNGHQRHSITMENKAFFEAYLLLEYFLPTPTWFKNNNFPESENDGIAWEALVGYYENTAKIGESFGENNYWIIQNKLRNIECIVEGSIEGFHVAVAYRDLMGNQKGSDDSGWKHSNIFQVGSRYFNDNSPDVVPLYRLESKINRILRWQRMAA